MIKRQKNKLSMYGTVRTYAEDNSSVYSENEEFVSHVNLLNLTLDEIGLKEDVRKKATSGKTKAKKVTRAFVSKQALGVSGAIYAYAKKTGDQPLMAKTDIKKSKLIKLRDTELMIELNSINVKGTELSSEIAKFGIPASKLDAYVRNIEIYSKAIGASGTGGAVKKGAFKTLSTLFEEADSIIDSMDRMVENYSDSHAEFYAGYKAARKIKDLGIRHDESEVPETQLQTQPENVK